MQQLQKALGIQTPVDPAQCLHRLQQLVFQQCQTLFPSVPQTPSLQTCYIFWQQSTLPVQIQVGPSVTVGCLRAAEARLQNAGGTTWQLVDKVTAKLLTDTSYIAGRQINIDPATSAPLVYPREVKWKLRLRCLALLMLCLVTLPVSLQTCHPLTRVLQSRKLLVPPSKDSPSVAPQAPTD